jgi:UDP-N-acetylmuramoyl-tripeptide--D-alanyl-D-alanine ligase
MIKNFLSRYTLRYPRYLVYMLQTTEYNAFDYLKWYHGIINFTRVEKRKKITINLKSILLLISAWSIIFLVIGIAGFIFLPGKTLINYFFFVLIFFLLPYFLAYAILFPLFVIKVFFQSPAEYFIMHKTKKRLEKHNGIKIGIAGSFGKTSMREIIKTVLSEGKKVAAPSFSYNTMLGISRFVEKLEGDEDVLIFEMGEYYPGDIKKLCDLIKPDIGIITGINEAHLQKFKLIEKTTQTIYELADYLQEKPLYVNDESNFIQKKNRNNDIFYSSKGIKEWEVKKEETGLEGTKIVLEKEGEIIEMKSNLLGLHQIGPLLVAFDIGLMMGMSYNQISEGISKTKPFEHRLELKKSEEFFLIDDSYNGNPDGVNAAIEFLKVLKNFRRIFITPGLVEMGKREEEVHIEIGRKLARANIEKIILIKNSVTPYIEKGIKLENYNGEVLWFEDSLLAFKALQSITVEGDVVLIQNDWPDQYQ